MVSKLTGIMRLYSWSASLFFLLIWLCSTRQCFGQMEVPKPIGKLIDLGGWRLHIHGQGMDKKGASVILECGAGDFSFDWALVQSKIANIAPVYAYDRAGSAWSDLGPSPHTMHQAVYELHTLLQKAGIPAPYILIGSSYGGLLVRLFALYYKEEVAGIILLDSGSEKGSLFINGEEQKVEPDTSGFPIPAIKTIATASDNNLAKTAEAKKILDKALFSAGMPKKVVAYPYSLLPDSLQKIRLWAQQQYEYFAANDNQYVIAERRKLAFERSRNPTMLGNIPLIVIRRGKPEGNKNREEEHVKQQLELVKLSSDSEIVVATGSGHHIQLEDPDIVVTCLKKILKKIYK